MADNILTKDRDDANIALAAKDLASVLYPRNILTDPSGTDITPLTDTALRATPVPVSGTVAVTGTFYQATQPVSVASLPLPSGAATDAGLASIFAALGSPFQAGASIGNTTFASTQSGSWTVTANAGSGTFAVSAASLPLPSGAATEATLDARTGALTETAPATDTASSGINGRLQRIAQRITSLIALLPASLGQKAGSSSLSVVEAAPTAVVVSLQTNATGTTYNAFGSQACTMLDIVNTAAAAVDLEVRRGGSGYTIVVPSGSSRMFVGITNASDLQVRRLDASNTQVTFTAEAIAQ